VSKTIERGTPGAVPGDSVSRVLAGSGFRCRFGPVGWE